MIARVISSALITQLAHRANRDLWEYRKHSTAKGTESAHLIQASLFWWLCWLYLVPSHTAPLHKPDSPLSQSWCKQQESFVSSQSWAGEWKSTQWHVICIDSTEGLGDDQRCLSGEAEQRRAAVIHEHLKSLGFVLIFFFFFFSFTSFFAWFKPANPDQTVIPMGEKHPGSTFECLWSQLLSMTDRQRHVRRASFDIMFRSAYQHKSVVNRSPSLHLFIYLFQISRSWTQKSLLDCQSVFFFP